MSATLRAVVVGGGVTGLAAAHRLTELARERAVGLDLVVLEACDRAGGQIGTSRSGSWLVEDGPDGFVTYKPAATALCERLGIGHLVHAVRSERSATAVLHRGRPIPLPDGFAMLAPARLGPVFRSPLFSWRGKLRIALEPWIPRERDRADESVRSFFGRRFGRELAERVAEPIAAGIWMADAAKLGLASTLPRFLEFERRHGSVIRCLRAASGSSVARASERRRTTFAALDGGSVTLVDRLVQRLSPERVRFGARVERIGRTAGSHWTVVLADGERLACDALVLACPAHETGRLLGDADASLAQECGRLAHASCATVNLGYRESALAKPLRGFGFFVPSSTRSPLLACSYVSAKFNGRAPAGHVLLRAFLGGDGRPAPPQGASEDVLAALAHRELAPILGITGEPVFSRGRSFERAMPQLEVGDRERVRRVEELARRHAGLLPCGGVLGAVGLPDCILSGETAAESAIALARPAEREALAASTR